MNQSRCGFKVAHLQFSFSISFIQNNIKQKYEIDEKGSH